MVQKNAPARKCGNSENTDTLMSESAITRTTVLDLVPFGNPGSTPDFFALRLEPPAWPAWKPGQFIMLRPAQASPERLWGRPFAVSRLTPRDLVIFFQVRGRGTAEMARLQAGDEVDIWGPLGNSLAVEMEAPTLLVAGGIGLAPFLGYVYAHPATKRLRLLFGHRQSLDCYPCEGLEEKIVTETHQDKTPEDLAAFMALLEKRIAENAVSGGLVLACGPLPLLREVQRLAARHGARAQLSLEERMACGIGACLGCVVKAKAGPAGEFTNVQTCTCGPNFWADAVQL